MSLNLDSVNQAPFTLPSNVRMDLTGIPSDLLDKMIRILKSFEEEESECCSTGKNYQLLLKLFSDNIIEFKNTSQVKRFFQIAIRTMGGEPLTKELRLETLVVLLQFFGGDRQLEDDQGFKEVCMELVEIVVQNEKITDFSKWTYDLSPLAIQCCTGPKVKCATINRIIALLRSFAQLFYCKQYGLSVEEVSRELTLDHEIVFTLAANISSISNAEYIVSQILIKDRDVILNAQMLSVVYKIACDWEVSPRKSVEFLLILESHCLLKKADWKLLLEVLIDKLNTLEQIPLETLTQFLSLTTNSSLVEKPENFWKMHKKILSQFVISCSEIYSEDKGFFDHDKWNAYLEKVSELFPMLLKNSKYSLLRQAICKYFLFELGRHISQLNSSAISRCYSIVDKFVTDEVSRDEIFQQFALQVFRQTLNFHLKHTKLSHPIFYTIARSLRVSEEWYPEILEFLLENIRVHTIKDIEELYFYLDAYATLVALNDDREKNEFVQVKRQLCWKLLPTLKEDELFYSLFIDNLPKENSELAKSRVFREWVVNVLKDSRTSFTTLVKCVSYLVDYVQIPQKNLFKIFDLLLDSGIEATWLNKSDCCAFLKFLLKNDTRSFIPLREAQIKIFLLKQVVLDDCLQKFTVLKMDQEKTLDHYVNPLSQLQMEIISCLNSTSQEFEFQILLNWLKTLSEAIGTIRSLRSVALQKTAKLSIDYALERNENRKKRSDVPLGHLMMRRTEQLPIQELTGQLVISQDHLRNKFFKQLEKLNKKLIDAGESYVKLEKKEKSVLWMQCCSYFESSARYQHRLISYGSKIDRLDGYLKNEIEKLNTILQVTKNNEQIKIAMVKLKELQSMIIQLSTSKIPFDQENLDKMDRKTFTECYKACDLEADSNLSEGKLFKFFEEVSIKLILNNRMKVEVMNLEKPGSNSFEVNNGDYREMMDALLREKRILLGMKNSLLIFEQKFKGLQKGSK